MQRERNTFSAFQKPLDWDNKRWDFMEEDHSPCPCFSSLANNVCHYAVIKETQIVKHSVKYSKD